MSNVTLRIDADSDVASEGGELKQTIENDPNVDGNVIVWAGDDHVRMILRNGDGHYVPSPDGFDISYIQTVGSTVYVGLE